MTAISKAWVSIADTAVDPDSPIDTALVTALRDNATHVREWLGASYTAGAVQDHNHDGVNSAIVPVGPNMLRNPSFENASLDSWTSTVYTGGTIALNTANAMHGIQCVAITSTVLANGGGDVTSNEYMAVSPGRNYSASGLFAASVAGVSAKIEIVFYDKNKSQISTAVLQSSASVPTTQYMMGGSVAAPSNSAYARVKITGGIPAAGTATGTIYVDGTNFSATDMVVQMPSAGNLYSTPSSQTAVSPTNTSPQEYANMRVFQDGIYRTSFHLSTNNTNLTLYGRIYRNGAAYGTLRSVGGTSGNGTFTEDLYFAAGDTVQVFCYVNSSSYTPSQFDTLRMGVVTAVAILPQMAGIGER